MAHCDVLFAIGPSCDKRNDVIKLKLRSLHLALADVASHLIAANDLLEVDVLGCGGCEPRSALMPRSATNLKPTLA